MSYQRSFKGYSVQNFRIGKALKHTAYKGELIVSDTGETVCTFEQNGEGFPTTVHWGPEAPAHKELLAIIGIDARNDKARENNEEIVTRYQVLSDEPLLNRFAEYGIEVICDDFMMDEHCRNNADHMVFARTSHDNLVQAEGHYRPEDRASWREAINQHLEADEEVLEIINDRFVSS